MTSRSLAEDLAALAASTPTGPALLAATLASLTDLEAAALAHDWSFWRRPKQAPPPGDWRSWGALGGRGMGKTLANTRFLEGEVQAGRASRIALIAQNEERCVEVLVNGESGLVTISPPWFRARFENRRVVWPNGAQAFVYTPERPGELYGPEHDHALASELHAWPKTKREEAFQNLRMGLRLEPARLLWDSNPSRRHPILRALLDEAEADPATRVVVRGTSLENRYNLARGVIDDWIKLYGSSQRGREMIYGEQSDEADGALWRQEWIDAHRRELPPTLCRRILIVDPAISQRAGTDDTGIVDAGLGVDDQVFVIADLTSKIGWEEWGTLVVKRYIAKRCDCVVVERNRGGDACVANLRACAAKLSRDGDREVRVEIVKADAITRHVPGVVYVKEVIGRSSKGTRAEPVATAYESGRVSHVEGADLANLEDLLTTWVPDEGGESPNALDALVWGVIELAGLSRETRGGGAAAIAGAATMQAALAAAAAPKRTNIATLLGGERGGDRL